MAGIADDFNRANANPAGGNWTTKGEGFLPVQVLSSRLASTDSGGDSAAFWNAATLGANQFAQMTIAAKANPVGNWGLFLRLDNDASTYYHARHYAGSPWTRIYKVVATVATQIAGDDTTPWATNDVIYFEANGSDLVLKRNGGTILNVSDGAISATGAIGVRISGYNVSPGDDSIDDFSGGDLGSTNLMAQICL